MEYKTDLIYALSFMWGALYTKILHDFYIELSPDAFKFIVLGVVVPVVAMFLLARDENATKKVTKVDMIITVILSSTLVWLAYEVSNQTAMPYWVGLVISFVLGLFSLDVALAIKKRIFNKDGVIDIFFKEIGDLIISSFKSVKNKLKRYLGDEE